MPSRHFLNALRPGTGTLPVPDPGVWHSHEDFLRSYADSVDIKGQITVSGLAHSIPSVFQRPIQFHRAMSDKKNPLHDALVSEWRGLMGVLGLKEWLDLRVTLKEFKVPNYSDDETSFVGNESCGDLHFRAMLRNQRPLRMVARGQEGKPQNRQSDWDKWWVIRCNDEMLGATSPWTLLYTASHYRAPSSVPWQKDGLLIDPILHYDPKGKGESSIELAILYSWVSQILDSRPKWNLPPELGSYANLLSTTLQDWQGKLARYQMPELALTLTDSLIKEPPYSVMLRLPTGLKQDDSDLYLTTHRGRVLLLHEHMAPEVRVHRGVFADRVNITKMAAEGSSFVTMDGVLVDQPYIIPHRLFFPSKIVPLDLSGDAFRPGNCSTPLRPSFFRYLTHNHLKGLTVAEMDGDFIATLRINLDNGREVTIQKEYAKEGDVIPQPVVLPAMSLWPRDYDPEWTESLAGYASTIHEFMATPLMSDGSISDDESGKASTAVRIWNLSSPAIGFMLRWKDDENPRATVQEAGLVLRRDLHEPPPLLQGQKWRVGVDFGTSSTTVMVDQGDGKVNEMQFGAHLLELVNPAKTAEAELEIARYLYPQAAVTPPFRTLLYNTAGFATIFGKATPFAMRFSSDIKTDGGNKPIGDLKWGMRGQAGANPLNSYLEALTRYIAWEARSKGVRDVGFAWSYPTSLPKRPLGDMQNFWSGLPNKTWHPGMHLSLLATKGMSESEAACRAITQNAGRIRAEVLTITVDIGGGSTDIAFWSKYKLLDQISFKLAGNDILDRTFLGSDALGEFYRICTGKNYTDSELTDLESRQEIYVNGALSDARGQRDGDPHKHPICEHIFQEGVAGNAPWIHFRSMVYLFFAGICYYMGAQSRSLAVGSPQVDLYFGGRGSAILTWFTKISDDLSDELEKAFLLGLHRAPDEGVANVFPQGKTAVRIFGQSVRFDKELPRLKTEVARGLLVVDNLKLEPEMVKGAPIGEVEWRQGTGDHAAKVRWNERLSAEQLAELRPPNDAGFASTMIGNFFSETIGEDADDTLEAFNLDPGLKKLVVNGQDVVALIQASKDAGDNVSQPIFAFELKALMNQYARRVGKNGQQQ